MFWLCVSLCVNIFELFSRFLNSLSMCVVNFGCYWFLCLALNLVWSTQLFCGPVVVLFSFHFWQMKNISLSLVDVCAVIQLGCELCWGSSFWTRRFDFVLVIFSGLRFLLFLRFKSIFGCLVYLRGVVFSEHNRSVRATILNWFRLVGRWRR